MIFFRRAILFLCSASCIFAHGVEEPPVPVVILGGGIGALTSSLYLARSGIVPLVFEGKHPGGAITQSPKVQNWPGEIEISGSDLIDRIRSQAEQNGVVFVNEEVVAVDFSQSPFIIRARDLINGSERVVRAYSCIIALGARAKSLGVPGESLYWSKGVYSCAVCDGALYRDKAVAVVGGGDSAVVEAEYLSHIAKKVYVLVRKDQFKTTEKQREEQLRGRENVEVLFQTEVRKIQGDGEKLTQIVLEKEGQKELVPLYVDALFLALGSTPNTYLFKGQLKLDENGYIILFKDHETSVPGVYAIGDVADPIYQQAISAAGDGAKAAMQSHDYLLAHAKPALITKAPILSPPKAKKKSPAGGVIEVKDRSQFEKEIRESNVPVFVDFYATWCGPCKYLAPFFDKWAKELQGKVKFLKVNVDACPDLAERYQIRAMPTAILFNSQGQLVDKKLGAKEIMDYIATIK